MAISSATTTLIGNLTRDPELKFLTNGSAMTKLGIAVNDGYFDKKTQEWVEKEPSFFNIICWRELGEHVAESLSKGMKIIAIGKLEQRTWETDDGEKRSVIELTADEVSPSLQRATAVVTRVATGPGAAPGQKSAKRADPSVPVEEPF